MRCDLNTVGQNKPQQAFMVMPLTVPSPIWANQDPFGMHAQHP